jgi:hypothetical protein
VQCARLDELTAASLELQATVKAKAAYTLSKLDQMMGGAPIADLKAEPKAQAPEAKKAPEPRKTAEPKKPAPAARPRPSRPPSSWRCPKPVAPKAPETTAWSTQTQDPASRDTAIAEPSTTNQYVPPLTAEEEGYSIHEIMAASEGLFGKVSANLAAVIEHLFRKTGRPTAYVLGDEGGGAFLAGVRYGKGTLYMRSGATQKIFWHGPSLGTDVGAEGSKTLFLIYKLHTPTSCTPTSPASTAPRTWSAASARRWSATARWSWRRSAPASACGWAPTSATSASRPTRPGIPSDARPACDLCNLLSETLFPCALRPPRA